MKNKVRDVILKRSSFIIVLLLILSAVALLRIVATHRDIDDVASIDLPLIEILTQIETNQLEQSVHFERAIRYAQEVDKIDYAVGNFIQADSNFRYLAKVVDNDLLEADYQVTKALGFTEPGAQRIKLKGLLLSIKKLEGGHTSYEEHVYEVLDLLEEGNLEMAILKSERVESEENEFNSQIEGVLMRHEMFTKALVKIVEEEEVLSMKYIVMLTLAFVLLSLVAVYTFSYRIWRPLEDIRQGAERLGAGDMDTRIKLRSSSITEDIVEAFNGMADKIDEGQQEIDRFMHFSYSTAHDLKAPIDNMKSLLDMLDKDEIGEANFDTILRNAKRSADQLSVTVNALNDVNHLREKLKEDPEPIKFDQLLEEVGEGMVNQIKSSNAIIKKDFSECKEVIYPQIHLKSILQNLLTNAVKYRNPDKQLVVEIKTLMKDGHAVLMIRDNGLGFDSIKYKGDVVKPFVRLHSHVNGSGLGMYIIKTILDFHKGAMLIDSQPKMGAKFTLKLN